MAERTCGANRAEVTSALEAVAANSAQLVAQGNAAFELRDGPCATQSARSSTAIAHTLPRRCRRTFPFTSRLASLRFATFTGGQFNEGASRGGTACPRAL